MTRPGTEMEKGSGKDGIKNPIPIHNNKPTRERGFNQGGKGDMFVCFAGEFVLCDG